MISAGMRSQGTLKLINLVLELNILRLLQKSGTDAYTCWAFSCASMLRTSTKLFIRRCHEIGLIGEAKKNQCLDYISEEKVHVELRNLIMMILLPKKLHVDDKSQAAFLRAAVSRVSNDK